MHNLPKSQSYQGLKLLLSDTKFMTTVSSMLISLEEIMSKQTLPFGGSYPELTTTLTATLKSTTILIGG